MTKRIEERGLRVFCTEIILQKKVNLKNKRIFTLALKHNCSLKIFKNCFTVATREARQLEEATLAREISFRKLPRPTTPST